MPIFEKPETVRIYNRCGQWNSMLEIKTIEHKKWKYNTAELHLSERWLSGSPMIRIGLALRANL
jgi:hypothetical protein